jgi:processive 1,2-diacylglycerol beta-glucosyltransferase
MHQWWVYDEITAYIGVNQEMFAAYRQDMRAGQAVWPLGIPVHGGFARQGEGGERDLRRQLALPEDAFICLMSGGGEGLLPMEEIIASWRRHAKDCPQVFFVAVCGKSASLANRLASLRAPYLQVLGFIDNIAEYMRAADVMFSKAGGVTVTEAIVTGLPMILYKPLPGQEFTNTQCLTQAGLAFLAHSSQEACQLLAEASAGGSPLLQEMRARQREAAKPAAAQDIARQIEEFLRR